MFDFVNRFLNSITMYRLLVYGLSVLVGYSLILVAFGILPYGLAPYIYLLSTLIFSCFVFNFLFGKFLRVETNIESWVITALILYFILFPVLEISDFYFALIAGGLAVASKFILNIQGRHIFNPAAFSIFILGLLGVGNAIWWVGSVYMLPASIILGILVVHKIRKIEIVSYFVLFSVLVIFLLGGGSPLEILLSWPIIFFASIMLIEPVTLVGRKKEQIIYAFLVGLIFSIPFNFFGILHNTPEFALLVGNVFAYFFSVKLRLNLKLEEKKEISQNTYEFSFKKDKDIKFLPGQYLEWTLPKGGDDNRGNRRYFTIASSPTEDSIKLGVKFNSSSSTFKNKLLSLPLGSFMSAGSLAGDFILPKDKNVKIAFIAGGIGITPFRSMVKYLVDKKEHRDIVLFYTVKTEAEIAYKNIFEEKGNLNLKVFYVSTDSMGFLNEEKVREQVKDYKERVWYLSGPNSMVSSYKKILLSLGISYKKIKTDYFPGF